MFKTIENLGLDIATLLDLMYINQKSDGLLSFYIHSNNKVGTVIDLSTSAKNGEIEEFAKDVAMHIAAMKPIALNRDSVDQDVILTNRFQTELA